MTWATARQTVSRTEEYFPTEWATYREDERDGEWQPQQAGDARQEGRKPVSSAEAIERPAPRRAVMLARQVGGAA